MNTRAIADLRGLGPKSQAMLAGAGIKTVAQLKRLGNILAWLFCGLSANAAMAIDLAPLWDFERPDVSEQRFRNALEKAAGDDALILRTQIARTYGLRKDFDGARKLLRRSSQPWEQQVPKQRFASILNLEGPSPQLRTPQSS
ncbi:MAG: TfoX/Sxy family DNA transformation protein [Betaproteobacteria bacterium]|nr:TfoX/Sxy family DNA transformation protein [Betaproteobacteria bacterium]